MITHAVAIQLVHSDCEMLLYYRFLLCHTNKQCEASAFEEASFVCLFQGSISDY